MIQLTSLGTVLINKISCPTTIPSIREALRFSALSPPDPDGPRMNYTSAFFNGKIVHEETLWKEVAENSSGNEGDRPVLKTVAAFLNTEGGDLLIGVGDDRKIVGIEHDRFDTDDKSYNGNCESSIRGSVRPAGRHP